MCEVIKEYTEAKTVTGYKVVIVDKYGHYISPFSGYRYKKGKITNPNFYTAEKSEGPIFDFARHSKMIGKTGIIMAVEDALAVYDKYVHWNDVQGRGINFAVLEMTITGDLYLATYDYKYTIIGDEIVSFKKIKL